MASKVSSFDKAVIIISAVPLMISTCFPFVSFIDYYISPFLDAASDNVSCGTKE